METNTELQALQALIWDLYKDVHGVRPRYFSEQEWNDEKFLQNMYNQLVSML